MNNTLHYLPARLFPFFHSFFKKSLRFPIFYVCGTFVIPVYEHVVVEHLQAVPQSQRSTAQRNQPCTEQQTEYQVRADQNAATQASRQELTRASVPSSVHGARCVLKRNEEIDIRPAYTNIHATTHKAALAGVIACTFNLVRYDTAFFLRRFYTRNRIYRY